MPEILLMTLAKNHFRIFKKEVRNQKVRKGGCTPPINPSPIKDCENLLVVEKLLQSLPLEQNTISFTYFKLRCWH